MIPPAFNAWNVSGTDYRDHLSVTPNVLCGEVNRVREYLVALFKYRLVKRPKLTAHRARGRPDRRPILCTVRLSPRSYHRSSIAQ